MIFGLKKMIALLLMVSLSACSSMRVVADGEAVARAAAAPHSAGLEVGREILLVLKDGSKITMTPTVIEQNVLTGNSEGKPVRVQVERIERIERSEIDTGKTWLAVGAVLLVVVLAAARSIGNDIDSKFQTNK